MRGVAEVGAVALVTAILTFCQRLAILNIVVVGAAP
jgi:hypothetical protein